MSRTIGTWATATVVAGTLDLLSAFLFSAIAGFGPVRVLEFVASGPLGDQALGAPGFAPAGLIVHYAIMACMAAAFVFAATRIAGLTRRPVLAGIAYGFALWILMYWIVRPLRWPAMPLPHGLLPISEQLFSHLILVGIPIAMITARRAR